MFKFITHRPLWVNILTGIALVVVILFLFIFSLDYCTHHNESKTVPYVLGRSLDDASKILSESGFEVEVQDSIYTDTTKPLAVLKQVPEADELVKVNRTVYLTINRAVPPMVEMPNLNGYSYRSAEMALRNANLQVGQITYKPDFAKDAVLETLYDGKPIAPSAKLRMGSKISLVLGDGVGEQKIVVPALIGKTYCEAASLLKEYGITFGAVIAEGVTDTCNAYIFWQSPEKFTEDKRFRFIRPGQMIDVKLQQEKPETDSMAAPVMPTQPISPE